MPIKKKPTKKKTIKKVIKKTKPRVKKRIKTKVPKVKIPAKLIKKLDEAEIKYEVIPHRVVFTAFDLAQTTGAKIQEITKTLLLKADKGYILTLLPANANLDLDKLKKLVKAKKIKFVNEKEMVKNLKIKAGAIHPFGSLFKLQIFVDNKVAKLKTAFFQPGSYTESIKMKVKDFIKLEEPINGAFSKAKKLPKPKMHKPKKKVKKTTKSTKKKGIKKKVVKKKPIKKVVKKLAKKNKKVIKKVVRKKK